MTNFWQFLAGLGVFLFGMWLLEDAMKELAGRTLKIFLRKRTKNKILAISSGTIVTAILQSSSVVSLMLLAFVGAGVMNMRNAFAVILGSNLGTTLTSWIVAVVGFKLEIENFSYPLIAVASIALIFFKTNDKVRNISHFVFGFGLMFLGIFFMKSTFEVLVIEFDFSKYEHYHRYFFVLAGFVFTALIQSSSAMVVIVLSALSQQAISFPSAVAIVIGSELGTSLKLSLGSIGNIAAKKRVALGNTIFNLALLILATTFMNPLILLVKNLSGENNPLIALVLFQTAINFFGIILFYPFLNVFGDFLEKRFTGSDERATFFIPKTNEGITEKWMKNLEEEVEFFIYRVMLLNMKAFEAAENQLKIEKNIINKIDKKNRHLGSYSEQYDFIKRTEGEILTFYGKIKKSGTDQSGNKRLEQLISSVRNAMYSAKSMKDVREDYKDFKESSQDEKYNYHKQLRGYISQFYINLNSIFILNGEDCSKKLSDILKTIKLDYNKHTAETNMIADKHSIDEHDIPTLLNVNSELYLSCHSIIVSVKEFKFCDVSFEL